MQIDNVFKDFSRSIFSSVEGKYQKNVHKGFLSEAKYESNVFATDTVANLTRFSDASFVQQTKSTFRTLVGKQGKYAAQETIGTHPDFVYLEGTERSEYHYAVSFFADIKNSTGLVLTSQDLIWTRDFKNTVLKTMTYFIQIFDGHVHRLQGDAIFALFAWKDKCPEDAIIDALNVASFLLKFIDEQLNPQLEHMSLAPLKIRIGIDYGRESDVLWSEYGIAPVTEVTTTSIHTDLAAKLQGKARSNSIMIGDNIKEFLDLPEEFLSVRTYQKGYENKEDHFIWNRQGWQYRMWVFEHKKYLQYFPIFQSQYSTMHCRANNTIYFPNIVALEKHLSLEYEVMHPYTVAYRGKNIQYEWSKINRGKEARAAGSEGKLQASSSFNNTAQESTMYRGHHIMQCKIIDTGRPLETLKFGIFIK